MKVGVIDLETGNLASLIAAIKKLNIQFSVCKSQTDFNEINKLILPGVGAFKDFMSKIRENGIDKLLKKKLDENVKLLGVCVGFQVLFEESNEFGLNKGLSLIKGQIQSFKNFSPYTKIPHVGWNNCKIINKSKLFEGIENNSDFYFTHSYALQRSLNATTLTLTNYDIEFISSINKDNIFGVQFHPEKSQSNGLKLLKNYIENC